MRWYWRPALRWFIPTLRTLTNLCQCFRPSLPAPAGGFADWYYSDGPLFRPAILRPSETAMSSALMRNTCKTLLPHATAAAGAVPAVPAAAFVPESECSVEPPVKASPAAPQSTTDGDDPMHRRSLLLFAPEAAGIIEKSRVMQAQRPSGSQSLPLPSAMAQPGPAAAAAAAVSPPDTGLTHLQRPVAPLRADIKRDDPVEFALYATRNTRMLSSMQVRVDVKVIPSSTAMFHATMSIADECAARAVRSHAMEGSFCG